MSTRRDFLGSSLGAMAANAMVVSKSGGEEVVFDDPKIQAQWDRRLRFVGIAERLSHALVAHRTEEKNNLRHCGLAGADYSNDLKNPVDTEQCAREACRMAKIILDEAEKS